MSKPPIKAFISKDGVRLFPKNRLHSSVTELGICRDQYCEYKTGVLLPPIYEPEQKSEEEWLVKALPSDWEPVSKPSKIIDNIATRRKKQHEAVVSSMKADMISINAKIENQIKNKAEELKQALIKFEDEGWGFVKDLDFDDEQKLLLSTMDCETVYEEIWNVDRKEKKAVAEFYSFLQDIEQYRSQEYKKMLREVYDSLHKISHQLPFQLQKFFEHEILHINQILLSNLRGYSNLNKQFSLQVENKTNLWLQTINNTKENWQIAKKKQLLKQLQDATLKPDCDPLVLQNEEIHNTAASLSKTDAQMQQFWQDVTPMPFQTDEIDQLTSKIQEISDEFIFQARKLLHLYKTAMVQVFNRYFDDLNGVNKELLELRLAGKSEIYHIQKEASITVVKAVSDQYSLEVQPVENEWNSAISNLHNKLSILLKFLRGSAILWNAHFKRVEDAQELVLKDLEKTFVKHDQSSQAQEAKISIALDMMRQELNKTRLDKCLADIYKQYDIQKKTYVTQYGNEVKTLEKYNDLVQKEIEVLIPELYRYLNDNPVDYDLALAPATYPLNTFAEEEEKEESLLPKQLKLLQFQVDAVHNWMLGLREAIRHYIDSCNDEISSVAREWIKDYKRKLTKRLEVKLALHAPKYQRLKTVVYNTRLAELNNHADRVLRHKAGVEEELNKLKQNYLLYEKKYENLIKEYRIDSQTTLQKVNTPKNTSMLRSIMTSLKISTVTCFKNIDSLKVEFQNKCKTKLNEINLSGSNFAKHITLFSEGGNFSHEEAKLTSGGLAKFEKAFKKNWSKFEKETEGKFKKIVNEITFNEADCSKTINYSLEEYQFNDNATLLVKDVQVSLKKEVYNMKFKAAEVNAYTKDTKEKAGTAIGDIKQLGILTESINELISVILKYGDYLKQLEPAIPAVEMATKEEMPLPVDESDTKITKQKNKKSLQETQQKKISLVKTLSDYSSLLFNVIPIHNGTFLSEISCILYKSFEKTQSVAKVIF